MNVSGNEIADVGIAGFVHRVKQRGEGRELGWR